MPDVLHLKPEEINTPEKRAQLSICVVGCEQTGALYSLAFAEAGYRVVCADTDQSLLKKIAKGRVGVSEQEIRNYVRAGTLSATDDLKNAAVQSSIILLTNDAKVDEKGNLDFSIVENSCRQVAAGLQRGTLVVFAGSAGFGFTDSVVKETLEGVSGLKVCADFGLAYAQAEASEKTGEEGRRRLMVASNDDGSLEAASLILSEVMKSNLKKVTNVKVAELASLFTSARGAALHGLANEFAVFCEKAGMDVFEVLKVMGNGTECDNVSTLSDERKLHGTELLLDSAESLEVKLRLPRLALQANEDTIRHAVGLVQNALRDCGKTLRRGRIAVLGAGSGGISEGTFVKFLEAKGARINLYAPRGMKSEESGSVIVAKRSVAEAVESCDCIVVLSGEEQFRRLNLKSLRTVMKSPAAVVDLAGLFDRGHVESEGFLYRGLGRGFERA